MLYSKTARKSTKGQMQGFEAVIVIVILMIIITLGIVFYTRMAGEEVDKTQRKIAYEEALELFSLTRSLPELRCSQAGGVDDPSCIDIYKARALAQVIETSKHESSKVQTFYYYNDLFGNARVKIYEIYPGNMEITLYERNTTSSKNIIPIRAPIKLLDPLTGGKSFGVLEVQKLK